ncbi:MAG: hypothetical protein J0I11_12530 [Actinobacteria bacterium]|nr:hypothetical protein [Actinomycetota bacterium]
MISRSATRAYYMFEATVSQLATLAGPARHRGTRTDSGDRDRRDRDRGDVPGWVMVTMMTAIVVIVLLGVFQEAVVNAVKNAFDSISGQGGQP